MANSVQFLERWRCLSDPKTTDNERAGNYTVLTSYLKEGSLNPSFSKELCRHQQPLLQRILRDVTCKSCDHAALQVLGYCLHNVEFASKFNKEQVNGTIKGLQQVITNGSTEKSVCTRALWCLTNQQLPVDHMTSHVSSIITMATEVVTVHQVGVATASSEALNVLIRFGQQFPVPFAKLTSTWYKAIVELIICKVSKVQHKALGVAVSHEALVQANHETTHWLTKILKERVVSVMLSQLTERGQDHIHVLKSWAHFVTVLGKTLHKHGSFLNELLRVVETGFKHRSPQVQVAAYDAWRTLITNFSLDLNLMTSSKRLKLLLMPLLASAVRERHDSVEQARIQTWWHLIGRLGNRQASQFQQICVPFLLLCLGMDPKSDISQLSDSICDVQSHSHSTLSDSKSSTDSSNATTPKSNSTISLAVTPTPAASSGGAPPTSATPTSSSHKHGRLLSAINTPRSRGGVEIEKAKKSSDRYQTPPTVAMVMTGCHALLEFTGGRDEFPHSLIKSDPGVCAVFPKLIVPMETAHFMMLFLDALLTYATQLEFKEKGINLDLILHHIVTVLTSSIEAEDGVSTSVPASAALLVAPLVDLLHSGGLTEHLGRQMRMDVLSQLSSFSHRLLLTAGGGRRTPSDCWRKLMSELLRASKPEQTSDWFSRNWLKLTMMLPATSVPLSNMLFLSNELSQLVKEGGMEKEICFTLWTSLANDLTSFIAKTSQVNNGTSVEPNFDPLRQILKFPFLHLLDNGERSHVTSVMDTWKTLYETANIHMGLVVMETNLCAELVCSDLYAAYGQYMKQVPSSLDQKHQVLRFDLYQNAVASALSYIMSKIKWGTLVAPATGGQSSKERRGGRVKSLETLLSLLAWQLAAFWDTAKKGPMQLSQLTTPYTLLDIVESLYHHVTSSALITMATEMIGQPLATLFEAILNSSPSQPSTGRARTTQQDIEHHVEKVWKVITICFQSRYAHPFDSALLSTLSPLLVATLNSSNRQLSSLAMSFWAVTFDKAQKLDYPGRLRDYFVKYLRDLRQPSELKLPGLSGTAPTLTSAQKELIATEDSCQLGQSEVIQFSDPHSQSRNQDSDVVMVDLVDVVLPNPSPQKKGVCGSFLNRPPVAGSPLKPRPGPSSPLAKQLDDILARSATTMERVQSSPLRGMGVADGKGAGSPLASARRRLDLGNNKEEYVSVGAPAVKKRRLLTEHQEEVMRERRTDLPMLYNALDPTLDSAPITMATLDQQSNEEDPIIISEPEDHLPPTSSSDGCPTSIPDSIPIPHSRPPASTSRDAPITIPDSPPLTPPTSSQPSIAMATTAPSSTASNITTKPSDNSSSVVQASVNSLPVATAQPSTTVVSLGKMLEINQSLIDATARLCAQTTLVLTGRTSLPSSSSQLPTPQPPNLMSIANQTPHLSTISTTTTNSQTHTGQLVHGAQVNRSMSVAKTTSGAQSTLSTAEGGTSVAAAKVVSTTSQSVSIAQAVTTSVQASSTAATCAVQSGATTSSLQPQSASSSTAAVQASGGQTRSISTATTSTNVLAQGGSISAPQSLPLPPPPPPSSTTTSAAASNASMMIKSSTSQMAPGSTQAGVLQPPTTSLPNPKAQGSGTLVYNLTVLGAGLDQSKGRVAATSSANAHSGGVIVTSSISKQSSTCVLPPATHIATSAVCTPTHTFCDPVSVASSFDQPYTSSSANVPYLFSAPVIISQSGRRGVAPPAAAQPTVPHSIRPAIGQVVEARIVQRAPPPPPPRVPGVPISMVTSTLPGHVTSIGVSVDGRHRVPTGVGQAVTSIVAQVVPPRFGVPPPPPPSQGAIRIPPGIPPGLANPPPPLQSSVAPPTTLLPSSGLRQLVPLGFRVGSAQIVSQGLQISTPRVVSQNLPALIATKVNDSTKIKNSEQVVISQDGGQRNLSSSSEALGQKTSMAAARQEGQKDLTAASGEEKAKEPEVRRRGRPRKVNRQEEGREKGGNGVASETKRGRWRPRKQSHDLIIEEYAPSNQGKGGGEGKEEERRRRSSRKRKIKSADGTISVATASTNEISRSGVQGRRVVAAATQSVRLASEKTTTEVHDSNPPSSSLTISIPTKTTSDKGSDIVSSHSVAAGTTSGSAGKVADGKGESSTAEGDASAEKIVEPENAKNVQENEQNVQPMDDVMDSQVERDATSINTSTVAEDNEDPLCGLKSKRRREREGEGEGEGGDQGGGEGEMEKRSRIEDEAELEGGDQGKGQADSPELITSETEVDQGEMMIDPETHDSGDTSESKKDESNSDSTGTKHAQTSDSKPLTASSETQSTEQSKSITSDSTTKDKDKTTSSSRESNGGRKCLSLRRHSTGPSAASSGDGVSGEGGERGEVGEGGGAGGGGEREETAAGGSRKTLGDTPTNGKGGGILKHTSQFDTPSTAKAGRRVQFATKPVFHEPQPQQIKQEEPSKPATPKQSRGSRTSSGSFSSRRTLLMSQTPPKMILVNKPHPPATPPPSSGPVYPSLKDCQSPVEQIIPALSPSSKFTHGLLQLVSAQNITTVGNISSLSEHEVQTLPIKSPKVQTLRGALRSFEQQLLGSKRKSSIDGEASLATPPPKKQPRLDSDLLSSSSSSSSSSTTTTNATVASLKDSAAKGENTSDPSQGEEGAGIKVNPNDDNISISDDKGGVKGQEARGEGSIEHEAVQSLVSKDAGSQEEMDVRHKEVSSEEAEDMIQEARSQEAENLGPQEATETKSQEAKEFGSHEPPVSVNTEMDQPSSHHLPGEQSEVNHEEEKESQEAENEDSEELSEGSCDVNEAMITLCTPESQLTPPSDDTNDTSDQYQQDNDTSEKEQIKEMDVDDGDHSETAHLESPPLTPPTGGHDLQPQPLSINHDHSYCSQTPDYNNNLAPPSSSGAPLSRECKIGSVNVIILDHTYCSQQVAVAAGETADSAEIKSKTGDTATCGGQRAETNSGTSGERRRDGENIGSKLSLTVHDHTYCSNSWAESGKERRHEPCLMEASSEHRQEQPNHQREDSGAVAVSLPKESNGERDGGETSPTAMDEGGVVMDDSKQSNVTSREEEREMNIAEVTHGEAPVLMELDTSGDSDVFTNGQEGEGEGESESMSGSSQSQELFSQQQPSQEEQQQQIALALERGDASSSVGAEESSSVPPATLEEGIIDQGANNGDKSANIAVVSVRDGSEGETERGSKDGIEARVETREVVERGHSAATGEAEVKGQTRPTTNVGGGYGNSADSSDSSSTHTYNAECSQRPPTLLSDSTHNHTHNHPTEGSSDDLMSILSQVRELCEKAKEKLDERDSLSQTELLDCLQTLDAVTHTTGKFTKAVVHKTRLQSGQSTAL